MIISDDIAKIINNALTEDVGAGDVTSQAVIPADAVGEYMLVAREDMYLCGISIAEYLSAENNIECVRRFDEGAQLRAGNVIATLKGNVRGILKIERVMLNFMQHLSGIATETVAFVDELANDDCKLLDTRKTTPGLREFEKFAVLCGGGHNHRMGLYDMVMIKDNHIKAAGGVAQAIEQAKKYIKTNQPENKEAFIAYGGEHYDEMLVEVECDNLEQVKQAVKANPDIILLDNFEFRDIEKAIEIIAGECKIEVSGNVTREKLRRISKTGVNYISTSKITQGARAVDIGLDEIS